MKWLRAYSQIVLFDIENAFLTFKLWYCDCKLWWIDFRYFLKTGKKLEEKFDPEIHRRLAENMKKFAKILPGATIDDYDNFAKNCRKIRFMSVILLKYEIVKFFRGWRR